MVLVHAMSINAIDIDGRKSVIHLFNTHFLTLDKSDEQQAVLATWIEEASDVQVVEVIHALFSGRTTCDAIPIATFSYITGPAFTTLQKQRIHEFNVSIGDVDLGLRFILDVADKTIDNYAPCVYLIHIILSRCKGPTQVL